MTNSFIGYGRQTIDQEDIDRVVAVLKGDYLTQGPYVQEFEEALASYVGSKYAVAVSNGTAALHLAALAAGAKAGMLGVTQDITFVASANCLAYCGASVGLVDIDAQSIGMDLNSLSDFIDRNPETEFVIPVAYAGLPQDPGAIREIIGERVLIEDACHALGGKYENGEMIGCCSVADMTCFSFHPVKPITTAEGGAITTNDKRLYDALIRLRSHGIERDPQMLGDVEGVNQWYYEQRWLGYNYRLTDLQAALGTSQLHRLDRFIERRREIAKIYDAAFERMANVTPIQTGSDRDRSGQHIYVVQIDFGAIGKDRSTVINELRGHGIGAQVHYMPVHRQPYHRNSIINAGDNFPNADRFYEQALTIPCYPDLSNGDISRVISAIGAIVSTESRP